jgi:hypothetical protein
LALIERFVVLLAPKPAVPVGTVDGVQLALELKSPERGVRSHIAF